MKVIIPRDKSQIKKINHGDIIKTYDNTYLVDRARSVENNRVFLIRIEDEYTTDYPSNNFEEIVSGWKGYKVFRKDEYCLEIKKIN